MLTDDGYEYLNNTLFTFLKNNFFHHKILCLYTPEQNALAEHKHHHICDTTHTLLHTSSVPFVHWPEATLTTVYLINRLPSPNTQNLSPYQLLFNKSHDYSHLRTFGCECFSLTPHRRHILQPKANQSIFLGYSESYKGFKCLNPITNKIHLSRHVTFAEHSFPFRSSHSTHLPTSSNTPPSLLIPTSIQPPTTQHISPSTNNSTLNTPTTPSLQFKQALRHLSTYPLSSPLVYMSHLITL